MRAAVLCMLAAVLFAGLACSKAEEEKAAGRPGGKAIAVKVLGVEGCAAVAKTLEKIETTAIELSLPIDLELVIVNDIEQAEKLRFLGSPTVLVNGVDIERGVVDQGKYGVT